MINNKDDNKKVRERERERERNGMLLLLFYRLLSSRKLMINYLSLLSKQLKFAVVKELIFRTLSALMKHKLNVSNSFCFFLV